MLEVVKWLETERFKVTTQFSYPGCKEVRPHGKIF